MTRCAIEESQTLSSPCYAQESRWNSLVVVTISYICGIIVCLLISCTNIFILSLTRISLSICPNVMCPCHKDILNSSTFLDVGIGTYQKIGRQKFITALHPSETVHNLTNKPQPTRKITMWTKTFQTFEHYWKNPSISPYFLIQDRGTPSGCSFSLGALFYTPNHTIFHRHKFVYRSSNL